MTPIFGFWVEKVDWVFEHESIIFPLWLISLLVACILWVYSEKT